MRSNPDFTPYRRATVGFDRLLDHLEKSAGADASETYPPFNIEQLSDDRYRITLAVPGFKQDDFEVVVHNNQLTVSGRAAEEPGNYLHRGIAVRPFERRFQLADFVEVEEADLAGGLLSITLRRVVPEAIKPRRIEISRSPGSAANDASQSSGQSAA